jgi:hypothetical protein
MSAIKKKKTTDKNHVELSGENLHPKRRRKISGKFSDLLLIPNWIKVFLPHSFFVHFRKIKKISIYQKIE